jgi:D-alanyl-D-alanine carboxypeptidase/Transglycosylase-like domain
MKVKDAAMKTAEKTAVNAATAGLSPVAGQAVNMGIKAVKKHPTWPFIAAAIALLTPVVALVVMLGGAAPTNAGCAAQTVVINDRELAHILATIRAIESTDNYQAMSSGSTASGAYQFLDTTWANYAGYPRAFQAPPAVQDQKAATWVIGILTANHGDVTTIPPTWYYGSVPTTDTVWDSVPFPNANVLTPRQYQQRWMTRYNTPGAAPSGATVVAGAAVEPVCSGVVGGGVVTVAGVDQLVPSQISWGGYLNGQIPLGAMRRSPHSGYLYPPASASWDQLYIAGLQAGFDLSGWSYRSIGEEDSATRGNSNHGWGLAIDVKYLTSNAGFDSPAYQWLAANAASYGWINPSWAKPVSLGGNGHGGHAGGSSNVFEPWHWEYAAFMTTQTATPAAV